MFRKRVLSVALALTALVVGLAAGVQAQQTEEQLVARLDSLLPLLEEAQRAAEAAVAQANVDAREEDPLILDTIQVGLLTIVTLPEQAGDAAETYGRIWEDEYAPFVQHSAALDSVLFTFQWSVNPVVIRMEGQHYRSESKIWRGRARLEGYIRESIGRALAFDLDGTEIDDWARDAIRVPENYGWIYRRMATTPSRVTRACLEGVPGACWSSLAIDIEPEQFLAEWYLPEERVVLAQKYFSRWMRQDRPEFEACLDRGVIEECDALLAEFFSIESPWALREMAPLAWDERITMVWLAVTMGGEGAWDRLVEDPEMPVGDALRYASGASTETLEDAWHAQVLAHRPKTHAGLAITKWTALFWILLFGALAMRSTRWRLA